MRNKMKPINGLSLMILGVSCQGIIGAKLAGDSDQGLSLAHSMPQSNIHNPCCQLPKFCVPCSVPTPALPNFPPPLDLGYSPILESKKLFLFCWVPPRDISI